MAKMGKGGITRFGKKRTTKNIRDRAYRRAHPRTKADRRRNGN